MWQPEPGWVPLADGRGPLSLGTWRVDGEWIVKRVGAPPEHADPEHHAISSPSYWRRELEFALADLPIRGLVAPLVRRVDEDDDGCTLWTSAQSRSVVDGVRVAIALADFASSPLEAEPWHAVGHLRAKVAQAEEHDGWPTLARTTVADLTDALWSVRASCLRRLENLPRVPIHGDLVRANVMGVRAGDVVAIDWGSFGWGAPGEDLGLYAASTAGDLDRLVYEYVGVLPEGLVSAGDVAWAARTVAAFTVIGRAEWALARVAPGEGALANKYRHPAVAPYLRALQNQIPAIEAVLAS